MTGRAIPPGEARNHDGDVKAGAHEPANAMDLD
jgi:hypothetical protein